MLNTNKHDIILNTLDNGIIILNKNLDIKLWNKWLEIRTGIMSHQIIDNNLADFFPNLDTKTLIRKISIALKLNYSTFYTSEVNNFLLDIEVGRVTDKVFENMQQSITIFPYDIKEDLVVIYIYDTTVLSETNYRLKQSRETILEKNEELELILDTTMEAIILFEDNKVFNCNQIAIELFNFSSKESLIDKDISILNIDKDILENNFHGPIEIKIQTKNKRPFHALINIKEKILKSQKFKILTIVDITEIKRKEELLIEQTKLAAMGEMIGNIAHQWRQPLNVISITASNAKIKKELGILEDNLLFESLKKIMDTTEHLSQTIDVFREFLNKDKEKNIFNLSDNINKSLAIIDTMLKKDFIVVEKNLDDEINLFNYSNELNQALINILNNARDALISNLNKKDKKIIIIRTSKNETSAYIEITDNAGGIKDTIIGKIFEPYFTTKHKYHGTGLGLYMTQKIIQMSMQGKIEVVNKNFIHNNLECKGASFKIELPLNLD